MNNNRCPTNGSSYLLVIKWGLNSDRHVIPVQSHELDQVLSVVGQFTESIRVTLRVSSDPQRLSAQLSYSVFVTEIGAQNK